jgi:hypothetical protein
MKNGLSILFLSIVLLMAVSYAQVVQKLLVEHRFSAELVKNVNDDAEESTQKTSEENARETDQDEDPFSINEVIIISSGSCPFNLKNPNYSFGQLGYYPEIVSPPPQG